MMKLPWPRKSPWIVFKLWKGSQEMGMGDLLNNVRGVRDVGSWRREGKSDGVGRGRRMSTQKPLHNQVVHGSDSCSFLILSKITTSSICFGVGNRSVKKGQGIPKLRYFVKKHPQRTKAN